MIELCIEEWKRTKSSEFRLKNKNEIVGYMRVNDNNIEYDIECQFKNSKKYKEIEHDRIEKSINRKDINNKKIYVNDNITAEVLTYNRKEYISMKGIVLYDYSNSCYIIKNDEFGIPLFFAEHILII